MKKNTLSIIMFVITLAAFMIAEKNLKALTEVPHILDKMLYYSKSDVDQVFRMLGAEGRRLYRYLHVIDYLFITSFAFVQLVLLEERLSKINLKFKKGILIVPILCRGVTDIIENIFIDTMLFDYPDISSLMVSAAYFTTLTKWVCLVLIIVEVIYVSVLYKKAEDQNHRGDGCSQRLNPKSTPGVVNN